MIITEIQEHPEFIPAVATWLYHEWIKSMPNGSLSFAESVLKVEPNIQTRLPRSFVAIDNGIPLGVARLTMHDMVGREELSPWLASVYVPETHRNNGIGSALCCHVINAAAKLGYRTLYLFTPDRESFYRHQGWKTVEKTEYRGKNMFVMTINIG